MSIQRFQHIAIPFDELQMFHSPQQNQMFLIQTLLLSTKVTLIVGKHKYSTKLVITKHNVWFADEKKKKNIFALPVNCLLSIIKSKQFPQLIFVTAAPFDNVHINVANQQRSNSILSGLSYLFCRILKNSSGIRVFYIETQSLKHFEKTFMQKKRDHFIEHLQNNYGSRKIVYTQKGNNQIYGELNIENKRICLMKTVYNSKQHMIHVARIVPNHCTSNQQINLIHDENKNHHVSSKVQDYFYVHTIEKKPQIIDMLRKYQPLPYEDISEQLVYVRELDYKIQLFFKYHPQLPKQGSPYYTYQLSPQRLFINLMEFYDLLLEESSPTVLTLDLLCYQKIQAPHQTVNSSKGSKNKRSFCLIQEYNSSFSQIIIKLRQFRYDFLLTDNNDMNKLIYHCYYEKGQLVYDPTHWKTKFYHLSLLLYEFLFGRPFFSDQLEPQLIIQMKKSNKLTFPKYIDTHSSHIMSWQLQNFIEKAIKLKFKSIEDVYQHPWIKQNVLILAYQRPTRLLQKNQDKKTDATKSF